MRSDLSGETRSLPRLSHPGLLHGADYNPDQWLDRPEVLARDIEWMKKAHVNCVSLGIFAWSALEPEEGRYEFGWMDRIIDSLYQNGIYTDLATPSGARPAWLAKKYPEVLRVDREGRRHLFGERHNHCLTSPVYREKTAAIDAMLARRYGSHPGVILWHIGNEFSGDCFCPLCQSAFRRWLQRKYGTVDELNRRWWTSFWSQRYASFDEVDPPSPLGEMSNPSMQVDWRRFCTDQCASFIRNERLALKKYAPQPATVNLMWGFYDYDYAVLAKEVDLVSWDCYPRLRPGDNLAELARACMNHDYMRSLKDAPFLLMESTPSQVNWHTVNQLKRPGMHLTSSLLSVFCGSDSVMYFQWRKGRGGAEAFHGAVIGHEDRCDTRVFSEVERTGEVLEKLSFLKGTAVDRPRVLLVWDQQSRWAASFAQTGLKGAMDPLPVWEKHCLSLFKKGIRMDLKDMDAPLEGYDLVLCPEPFMYRNGFGERLRDYVRRGGHVFQTCFGGIVDEDDLCFTGGAPHAMTDVLGIRDPELDALYPEDELYLRLTDGRRLRVDGLCEYPQQVTAGQVLGTYENGFMKGTPALTFHRYGKGGAWYLAARLSGDGLDAVYGLILEALSLHGAWPWPLPEGCAALERGGAVLLANLSGEDRPLSLPRPMTDLLTGGPVPEVLCANGCAVIRKEEIADG